MCPGGAVNFTSGAVTFDPAWIYGCNTGTSCNGGVNFDNRASCQPTTAMDACAPAPTCGSAPNNGSNIWFKFYAAASTVTISCFQNTSFVIGVQAFSGGPTCGSLTQVGCAIAAGPSGGVNLTMNGLTVGQLYYYRIFGSSGPVAQRTGLYCFCGSAGLDNYVLASGLKSFKGFAGDQSVKLTWETDESNMAAEFTIEMSSDQRMFYQAGTVRTSHNRSEYSFTLSPGTNENVYYRLRFVNASGDITYSPMLKLRTKNVISGKVSVLEKNRQLRVHLDKDAAFVLCGVSGSALQQFNFKRGDNIATIKSFPRGIYFIKDLSSSQAQKIVLTD